MIPAANTQASNRSSRRSIPIIIAIIVVVAVSVLSLYAYSRSEEVVLSRLWFVSGVGHIDSVQFSSDGRYIMTVDYESGATTVRDTLTSQVVRELPGHWFSTTFSDDGTEVLQTVSSKGGTTRSILTDIPSGDVLRRWTGKILYAMPDLSLMVTTDDPHKSPYSHNWTESTTGRVVDISTGRTLGQFNMGYLWRPRLSSNGRYLCLPNPNGSSHLLRVPEMTDVLRLPALHSMYLSPSGDLLIGITYSGTLEFWQLPSGHHWSVNTGLEYAETVYQLNNGRIVISARDSGEHNCTVVQIRSSDGRFAIDEYVGIAKAFSPDMKYIAMQGGGNSPALDVYDAETGSKITSLQNKDAIGNPIYNIPGSGDPIAIGPGAHGIAFARNNGILSFYAANNRYGAANPSSTAWPMMSETSGTKILKFGEQHSAIFDVITLPGGGVAASGGAASQPRVQIWRPGHDVISVSAPGNGTITSLGMSPDGKVLAGSSCWGVWTYCLSTGTSRETPITVGKKGEEFYPIEPEGRPIWRDGPNRPFSVVSDPVPGTNSVLANGSIKSVQWDDNARHLGEKTLMALDRTVGKVKYKVIYEGVSPDGMSLIVIWNGIKTVLVDGKPVMTLTGIPIVEHRDAQNGTLLRTFDLAGNGEDPNYRVGNLGKAVFSRDGKLVALLDNGGCGLICNVNTGSLVGVVSGMLSEDPQCRDFPVESNAVIAFSPDDRFFALGLNNGIINIYSLSTFMPLAQLGEVSDAIPVTRASQIQAPLRWISFDSGGKLVYGTFVNGDSVYAWPIPRIAR